MAEQQSSSNAQEASSEENNGFAQQLALLQELYQRQNSELMNQLQQQCSQMSAQDYLQSLHLFANLSGQTGINNTEQNLNNVSTSVPSASFLSGSLPGPQRSLDTELPTSDSSSKESPLQASTSGTLTARNRRTFSGSGQTISQHTRDRLKSLITNKKQKQRLHSASSIGSQSSMVNASSSSNVSWLKEAAKAGGSDINLIGPMSPGPSTVAKLLQQQTSNIPTPLTPSFEPYPTPNVATPTIASQLNEYQLRKVNSEPNLKMKLRARLLNKGSSPVTHSVHPYNNAATAHSHHRPLQRADSDSVPLQTQIIEPQPQRFANAQSTSALQMPPNFVIPSPSLPNLSNNIEQLQMDWQNFLLQTSPFASFLSMPSLLRNSLLPQNSSILDPQIDSSSGANRFETPRTAGIGALPLGGYSSLLKQQLRDIVLRRKSLVREEPEDESLMEALQQRLQTISQRNNQLKTGLAYDAAMSKHSCLCGDNQNHVEHGGRVHSIWARLQERGLVDLCEKSATRKASLDLLKLVHTPIYSTFYGVSPSACLRLEASEMPLKSFVQLACGGIGVDSDTYFNDANTQIAIRMAVGSLVELASQVAEGKIRNGFACIRPPGHHAEREQAMGFCFFNNVAITARYLQKTYPNVCNRIAIIDWDVHHGNGTQLCFESDPNVLYLSIHRHDNGNFFPGTGAVTECGINEGRGYTINVPFSGDVMGDAEYLAAWRVIVLPILDAYAPDFILVSAGFDAALGHMVTLGGYEVSPRLFGYLTRTLLNYANGRVVLALEGGYDLPSICDSAESCVKALCDNGGDLSTLNSEALEKIPNQAAQDTIQKVIAIHKKTWPTLTGNQGINASEMFWQTSQSFPSLTVRS